MRHNSVESVLANLQSGIIVVDLEFRIEMVNNYVTELSGVCAEQWVGKNLRDISPELYANIQVGETASELPINLCGMQTIIGYKCSDFTAEKGHNVGYIINFRDLTEVVRIRSELRQKKRLAAIGEVVGRVAHEMRNPLFGLTAAAQILEMELPLSSIHKELMDSLLKESRRLNNLVEVLHESTSELRITRNKVDLVGVIEDSLQAVEAMRQEKGVSLRKDYECVVWLFADADKLTRVMINLLKNALDASVAGGEISLAVATVKDSVTVLVTDHGNGIPPENLERIFDVFYTTRKNRSGLGLPSSRRIVAAHGGSLTASNTPEGGARFVLQLPLGDGPL